MQVECTLEQTTYPETIVCCIKEDLCSEVVLCWQNILTPVCSVPLKIFGIYLQKRIIHVCMYTPFLTHPYCEHILWSVCRHDGVVLSNFACMMSVFDLSSMFYPGSRSLALTPGWPEWSLHAVYEFAKVSLIHKYNRDLARSKSNCHKDLPISVAHLV